MKHFAVWHQGKPKHRKSSDDWEANLKIVGHVQAENGEDAIAQAKMQRMTRWPIVCEAETMQ